MADGTPVRAGSVASNQYPLGTHLIVSHSPTGRHHFVVRDRIGWGTELDFWVPTCSQAYAWGRRTVRIRKHQHHIDTLQRQPRRIYMAYNEKMISAKRSPSLLDLLVSFLFKI